VQLSVHDTPDGLSRPDVAGAHVIAVDVLRASTTIVEALDNGVASIIPVAGVRDARRIAGALDRDSALLGGERGGQRIDGFDLGNSPLEYRRPIVEGKTLVFTTSNGTRAITQPGEAREVLVACLRNLAAVVARLLTDSVRRVALVCGGDDGCRSVEDHACAGLLAARLVGKLGDAVVLDEAARQARASVLEIGDVGDLVRASPHGRRLAGLGFHEDVEFCSRLDASTTVPVVFDGRVIG
jgi:2-phosphosulfolactate phosphatase